MKTNFKQILKNTWLCIKYPFLYPRNRFTDEHYTNRIISNKIHELRTFGILSIPLNIMENDKFTEECKKVLDIKDNRERKLTPIFEYQEATIILRHHNIPNCSIEIEVRNKANNKIISNTVYNLDKYHIVNNALFYITKYKTLGGEIIKPYIYVSVKTVDDIENDNVKYKLNNISVNLTKFAHTKIYLLRKLNTFLGIFHILPSYTELDAMETGWRIKFGEDICREIKTSLLHTYTKDIHKYSIKYLIAYIKGIKLLLNYRIMQIKEKFGCYDEQTEVLTKSGWKFFKDVSYLDEFATLDNNDNLIYQQPTDIINYSYTGNMYKLCNRGIDLFVTPNHNLYIAKGSYYHPKTNEKRVYSFELCDTYKYFKKDKRFKKGCNWVGTIPKDIFKIPDYTYINKSKSSAGKIFNRTYTLIGPEIEIHSFLRFLGFYIAEGYTSYTHGTGSDITVSYNKYKENELVTKLINDIGFKCSIKNNGIKHFSNAPLAIWLKENCGHKALNKKVPNFIFDLPPSYIEEFLTYLYIGDGYLSKTSNILTTISKQLSDDVCELLLKSGYSFRVFIRNKRDPHYYKKHLIKQNYQSYNINWLKNTEVEIDYSKVKNIKKFEESYIPYTGNVYCVTIPNHILYIRRNGKGVWCGNSLRWYSEGDTQEIFNIINKYEDISYKTCIVCGKDAKYMTRGWVCPYCEEHVPDKDNASLINEIENELP